jgi:hypothetical protein
MRQKTIPFNRATELLRQPDHLLVEMKSNTTKRGHEFFIVPGGSITDETAKQLLEHPLCHEVDPGLFPGLSQSWTLYSGNDKSA